MNKVNICNELYLRFRILIDTEEGVDIKRKGIKQEKGGKNMGPMTRIVKNIGWLDMERQYGGLVRGAPEIRLRRLELTG